VGARDRRVRKRLLIDDDEVEVLAVPGGEALEALVWADEAEEELEELEELVLLLLLCVERVGETAERSRSLNAIFRAGVFFFFSLSLAKEFSGCGFGVLRPESCGVGMLGS
jgi:hypothetical protein